MRQPAGPVGSAARWPARYRPAAPRPTPDRARRSTGLSHSQFDLRDIEVYGPLRPRLTIGPIDREQVPDRVFDLDTLPSTADTAVSTLVHGFATWYLRGGLGFVVVAAVAGTLVGIGRVLAALRRAGRAPTVAGVDRLAARTVTRTAALAVLVAVLGCVTPTCSTSPARGRRSKRGCAAPSPAPE